jgi:hypothetical protein
MSNKVYLVYKSYLGYKRLKSLIRKVKERRFRGRFKRFIIISPKPILPREILYILIIISNKEL